MLWADQVAEQRDAMDKARNVILRLRNRHLTKGLVTWMGYAEATAHRMAAMRAVAETVINRGKRQAMNTFVEIAERAAHWRQSRRLIELRHARGILVRWSAQGLAYRSMKIALRRLFSRELTRGWMRWVGDWREAHAIMDAAMARAANFVGRALHFEQPREASRPFAPRTSACSSFA